MSASTSGQGPASTRFAPYIEELQEFFASSCLRCGTPEDILDLTERVDCSPAFAEDLSSMVRSIVLREGGGLPHSQLLEILAISIGGPKMDHSAQQFSQPLRYLLSFISGVLRKPWNEPPGESRQSWREPTDRPARHHQAEIVPFPVRPRVANERFGSQAATISAAAERAAHENLLVESENDEDEGFDEAEENFGAVEESVETFAEEPELEPEILTPELVIFSDAASHTMDQRPADPRRDRKIPDPVGDPTPAETSALDPETPAREAIQDPDSAEEDLIPAAAAVSAEAAEADTSADAVFSTADDFTNTLSWRVAAETARGGAVADPVPATTSAPPQPAAAVSAKPAVRPERLPLAPASAFEPVHTHSSHSAARPFTQSATNSASRLAKEMPHVEAMEPSFLPRMPKSPAGILVAGAAMLVVAGIVATSLNRTTELVGKQAAPGQSVPSPTPAASTAHPASLAQAHAAVVQTAASAPVARVRRVSTDEDDEDDSDVAPPYSTPVPQQEPVAKPSPYIASNQPPAPVTRPPSNEVASNGPIPAAASVSTGRDYPSSSYVGSPTALHSYRNPDAAIAGDMPFRSRPALEERIRSVDISSGMMANNLISAPMPDYPTLARLTHVSGEVVIQAVIGKNGSVMATHVMRGNRLLRGAAQDAVKKWRFKPYVMDGRAVEVSTIVTVRFKPHG